MTASVRALHRSSEYTFTKEPCDAYELLAGLGVADDVHAGATVRHRSRVARDPNQPNLRQVHLWDGEMLDMLAAEGFEVAPGMLGENLTTTGLDALSLPTGTLLRIGESALLALTGVRNPCAQIEAHHPKLLKRLVQHGLTGAMSVVVQGGPVRVGDPIVVQLPPEPHQPLQKI